MNVDDLNLLPPRLAAASLSQREIVLTYADALQAIEHLAAGGHAVFCWEGWLRYGDGACGHSARHQGMVEAYPGPSRDLCRFRRTRCRGGARNDGKVGRRNGTESPRCRTPSSTLVSRSN